MAASPQPFHALATARLRKNHISRLLHNSHTV